MRFGAIIRSFGERTKWLCHDSIINRLPEKNIHFIKNVFPFSEVVEQMIVLASEKGYDWYIGVDADIVLVPDWLKRIENTLREIKDIDSYYKIDFQLKDKFVNNTLIYGLHLYNGKYNKQMFDILKTTKNTSKPEGNIRHKINAKFINLVSGPIGYHGYEQYYRDIYSRFAIRSFRNVEDIQRYNLFEDKDEDNVVGYKGWKYGLKNKESILSLLDANNRITASKFGYKEKKDLLNIGLEEFYANVNK